ncbi:MAG: nuclear transport factor 2 family protein [Vicinamibacterales bacterium]|nr:nuclear transport factor 2 family protein [Vicinamibacterales bacterium]
MDVISTFYAALQREDYASARQCLADEGFSFVGWFDVFDDPDAYIEAVKKLRGFATRFEVKRVFVDDGDVALFYEIETVRGDVTLVAAWFQVREARIARVRIVCDTRPFAEVWGRT